MSRHVKFSASFIARRGSNPFRSVTPKARRDLLKSILGNIAVNQCVDSSNELFPLPGTTGSGVKSVAFRRWRIDYICDASNQIVCIENIYYVPRYTRNDWVNGGAEPRLVDRA